MLILSLISCELSRGAAGIFFPVDEHLDIDQCNETFNSIFGGSHRCDPETTEVRTATLILIDWWLTERVFVAWNYSRYKCIGITSKTVGFKLKNYT
jgi:hypothetical protein